MTFAEKVDDYTVVDKKIEVKDGISYEVATLRTHSGYKVICRTPIHTPEEEKKIAEGICEALIELAYPGIDLSNVSYMEVKM